MDKKVEKVEAVATITVMEVANWDAKHIKPVALTRDPAKFNRTAWLLHIRKYDGKTVEAWLAAVAKKQPATIKKGSKTKYTPAQWIGWFVKAGVVEITIS